MCTATVPNITCATCAYWNAYPSERRRGKATAICLHLSRFEVGNDFVLTGSDYSCAGHLPESTKPAWAVPLHEAPIPESDDDDEWF